MEPLIVTQGLLSLLRQRRIYTSRLGIDRWKPGDTIGVHPQCALEPYAQLFIGNIVPREFGAFSYARSTMGLEVSVARYTSIGEGVMWMGADHPAGWASSSPFTYDYGLPAVRAFHAQYDPEPPPARRFDPGDPRVWIGNDVWIGDGAMVAPGVTIGDGAIVGARTLVREDVPPYAIVVGQPARILRLRFPEPLVERFAALQWWRFTPAVLQRLPVEAPEQFLDALEARLASDDPPAPINPVYLRLADLKAVCETQG